MVSIYTGQYRIWTALLLGMCGMFLLGWQWQAMWPYEGMQWTIFCLILLYPTAQFSYSVLRSQQRPVGVPMMAAVVFYILCAGPLVCYWSGYRLQSLTGFPAPSHEDFCKFGLLVSLFCLMVGVAYELPLMRRGGVGFFARVRGPLNAREAAIWAALCFLVGAIPFVLLGGGSDVIHSMTQALLKGRSEGGLQFETTSSASRHAHILVLGGFHVVAGVLALYGLTALRGTVRTKLVLGLIGALSLVFVASGGGRTRMLYALFPVVVLVSRRLSRSRGRRRGALVVMALLLVLSAGVFAAQSRYRDLGWRGMEDGLSITASDVKYDLSGELVFIVSAFPDKHSFICGASLLERMLRPVPELLVLFASNPVPRTIWRGKPLDPSFGAYNYIRTGNDALDTGSTVTATIIGRAYMKYGLVGVAQMGLLMG